MNAQKESLTQTIRGQIVEKQSLHPIYFATIVVEANGRRFSTLSDSLGYFRIASVPVGRCKLWVLMMGYHNYANNNIVHLSRKETVLSIPLEESIKTLDEFVIIEEVDKTAAINRMAGVSSRLLSVEEANRYAGSWGDPSRMVANLAGVAATNDTRNDIIVRGNSPAGVLWRLDGFDIENPNHFGSMGASGGPIGMINSNLLANSDFYTGAFPAQFGNATTAIFDLRLRTGNNQKHEFLTGLGANGFELGAEGPISKKTGSTYMINGRYSFLKLLSLIDLMDSFRGTVPHYQDLNFKFDFPMKKGNLSLIGLMGTSFVNLKDDMMDKEKWDVGDLGQNVLMRNIQAFTGLNYTHKFGRRTRLINRLSFQSFNSIQDMFLLGFENISKQESYKGRLHEHRYTFSSTLHHRFDAKNNLVSGIGSTVINTCLDETYDPDLNKTGISQNRREVLTKGNIYSTLYQGHIQWEHAFTDNFKILPGVHSQYYDFSNDFSVEPRLGINWNPWKKTSLNFGLGILSQIQPRQMLMFRDEHNHLTNKHVKNNKSAQAVVGIDFSITASLRLKTEIYYQHLYNIPTPLNIKEESALNLGDDFYNSWHNTFVNKGKGRNYGVEMTLEKFFDNHYYFLITAALYDSRYTALDKIERKTKFNGHFLLNTLFGYEWRIGQNMYLSLNAKLAWLGGKRYIPANINSANPNDPQYDYSQAYSKQLPQYFKTDLNLSMKQNHKYFSIEWFIEGANLTNHKNILMHHYNPKKMREEYYYQMGFMPGAGIKVHF